jgi:hypothetical protein
VVGPPALRAARVRTLMLHKASVESRLGLSLRGDGGAPPVVSASSGLAAAAGLRVGESILSVNGQRIDDHEQATELMRRAEGDVRLRVAAAQMVGGGEAANGNHDSQPAEPAADVPSEKPLPPMRSSFVSMNKPTASTVVGIRLVGRDGCPPYIAQLTPGAASVAAAMGELGLKVGQALLSVNGLPVRSAAAGDRALAQAVGRMELEVGEEQDTPSEPVVDGHGVQPGMADLPAPSKAPRPKPKPPAVAAASVPLLTEVFPNGVADAAGGAGGEARAGKKQRKRKPGDKNGTEADMAASGASKPAATVDILPTGFEPAVMPVANGAAATVPKAKGKLKKSAKPPLAPAPAAPSPAAAPTPLPHSCPLPRCRRHA